MMLRKVGPRHLACLPDELQAGGGRCDWEQNLAGLARRGFHGVGGTAPTSDLHSANAARRAMASNPDSFGGSYQNDEARARWAAAGFLTGEAGSWLGGDLTHRMKMAMASASRQYLVVPARLVSRCRLAATSITTTPSASSSWARRGGREEKGGHQRQPVGRP